MAITKELLEILACPETKEPVALAEETLVERVNSAIAKGSVKDREGNAIERKLDGGLLRQDGAVLYPIRNEIPIMLISESIDLKANSLA